MNWEEDVRVVCINLDSRPDRWARMQTRLQKHGLLALVERKRACVPDEVTIPIESSLQPGQKACTQSHVEVLQSFLRGTKPYLLLLEDDVAFRNGWREVLAEKLEELKKSGQKWHGLFLNAAESLPTLFQWQEAQEQFLAGAILYSKTGAERLLQLFPVRHAIDWMTWVLQRDGLCHVYFPWLAIQEGSYSDIQRKTPEHDFGKVKRLLCEAARASNDELEEMSEDEVAKVAFLPYDLSL